MHRLVAVVGALLALGHTVLQQVIGIGFSALRRVDAASVVILNQAVEIGAATQLDGFVRIQIDRARIVRCQQCGDDGAFQALLRLFLVQCFDGDQTTVKLYDCAAFVILCVFDVTLVAGGQYAALAPLLAGLTG